MITTPTTLVLGAGASYHLGYPLGAELKEDILRLISSSDIYHNALFALLTPGGVKLAKELKTFLQASGVSSIDAFLRQNPSFSKLGKYCIAACIHRAESKAHHLSLSQPVNFFGDGESRLGRRNWYLQLWEAIRPAKLEDFSDNKLSIVTFNYDMSLEAFLFQAFRHYFKDALPDDEHSANTAVETALASLPIHHVHGTLPGASRLLANGKGRALAQHDIERIITDSETALSLIGDDVGGCWDEASCAIDSAEKVLFLGFGYAFDNIDRLDISWDGAPNKFYGTCYGMPTTVVHQVRERYGAIEFTDGDCTIDHYLDEHYVLLSGTYLNRHSLTHATLRREH